MGIKYYSVEEYLKGMMGGESMQKHVDLIFKKLIAAKQLYGTASDAIMKGLGHCWGKNRNCNKIRMCVV